MTDNTEHIANTTKKSTRIVAKPIPWIDRKFKIGVVPVRLWISHNISSLIHNRLVIMLYISLIYSFFFYLVLRLFYPSSWLLFFASVGVYFVYKEIIDDIIKIRMVN